jgi:hypothetical protein
MFMTFAKLGFLANDYQHTRVLDRYLRSAAIRSHTFASTSLKRPMYRKSWLGFVWPVIPRLD